MNKNNNNNSKEIRIVLVDDHQLMRQGLRQLLAAHSDLRVVGEAADGPGAMEQIRSLAPDVVLMDVHLPGDNGVEITRRVRAHLPAVKIIALSSDSNTALVVEALHAGVSGYVLKENGADELVQAVRTVMDHRVHLSPQMSSEVIQHFMAPAIVKRPAQSSAILSERERLLLKLVAQGKRNKEIADILTVAIKSVETYRSRLMKKLGCGNTADLVRYAIREGIEQA